MPIYNAVPVPLTFTDHTRASTYSDVPILIENCQVSDNCISFMLGLERYRGHRYWNGTKYVKGYNYDGPAFDNGITETNAYRLFIDQIKQIQIKLKKKLAKNPATLLQHEFDALVSFFYSNGSIEYTETDENQFNLLKQIRDGNKDNVASLLITDSRNPRRSSLEANLYRLGSYPPVRSRQWLRNEGIQYIRQNYSNLRDKNNNIDTIAQKQARYSYYKEVKKFITGTSELEQREVMRLIALEGDTTIDSSSPVGQYIVQTTTDAEYASQTTSPTISTTTPLTTSQIATSTFQATTTTTGSSTSTSRAFSSLTGLPTTISGYGITDLNNSIDLHLNQSNPISGYVLTWNGTDYTWTVNGTGSGLGNVVDDITPQLGGNLDLNNKNITGTGNINIAGTLQVSSTTTVGGDILPDTDDTYDLGSTTHKFKDLHLSGSTIYLGGTALTRTTSGQLKFGTSIIADTSNLATVATTGAYSDITGTPSLATVATTGAYSDLSGTPSIPSALTVSEINDPSNNVSVSTVSEIKFDVNGGFALTDNSDGSVTVALESTFKTWKIYDNPTDTTATDIIASGVDTISLKGGTGVGLAGVATAGSKSLTFSIGQDVSTTSDVTFNDLNLTGDLTVSGTTTTVDTATLDVTDLNITIAKNATNSATADGAGLTVAGANATMIYTSSGDKWVFNKPLYHSANKILTTADEGTGNGLDADTLDGQEGTHYLDYGNFTNTPTIPTATSLDVDDLQTLSGVAGGSTHLGTFTGSTIADNLTVKASLQALETAVENAEESTNISGIYTGILGVSDGDANLGTFTGATISDNRDVKEALQDLETAVEAAEETSAIDAVYTGALGLSAGDAHFGTFTGTTITDNRDAKEALQELETALESSSSNTLSRVNFTGNGSTQHFALAHGQGTESVYLNGVKLLAGDSNDNNDYFTVSGSSSTTYVGDANNGTHIYFHTAPESSGVISIDSFAPSTGTSPSTVPASGGTFTGNLNVNGTLTPGTLNVSAGTLTLSSSQQEAIVSGGKGSLTVSEINDPNNNISVSTVTGIKFDVNGGFALTDNGDDTVTVALESTFKTWKIFATPSATTSTDVVASAVDTISIKAGTGIALAGVTTSGSKSLTISSTASSDVVDDTSPQLGGNLDLNSNDITGTGNIDITGTLQVSSTATVGGDILPDTNDTYDLGSTTHKFKDLHLSGSTIYLGGTALSRTTSGQLKFGTTTLGEYSSLTGRPNLATVATSGAYSDITGTPSLATVATSGAYSDLSGAPADLNTNFQATASGAISDGDPVIILSDGKVTKVGPAPISLTTGTIIQYANGGNNPGTGNIKFDRFTAGKFYIAYKVPNGYVKVGTIDNTGAVTFGSAQQFATNVMSPSMVADSLNQNTLVVSYEDKDHANNYAAAVVGTVSGDTITWGTPSHFTDSDLSYGIGKTSLAIDKQTANRIAICWGSDDLSKKGYISLGTIDPVNRTITWSTQNNNKWEIEQQCRYPSIAFDPHTSGRFIAGQLMGSYYMALRIGTVSGTGANATITFGSNNGYYFPVPFTNSSAWDGIGIDIDFDPTNADHAILVYRSGYSSGPAKAFVITLSGSGTTLSALFGSPVTFDNSVSGGDFTIKFDPNGDKEFVITYPGNKKMVRGKYSGTGTSATITFDTPVSFTTTGASTCSLDFDPNHNGRFAISWEDTYQPGKMVLGEMPNLPTNLTTDNFGGISAGAYTDGQTATIQGIGMVDDAQSGLTPGLPYYIKNDGTLSTAPDVPSVMAGTGLTATTMRIGGFVSPEGIDSPSFTATLSGPSISNGTPLIINEDGTVSSCGTIAKSTGSVYELEENPPNLEGEHDFQSIDVDPHNPGKFIVAYTEDQDGPSAYGLSGCARVCSMLGTTVTVGPEFIYHQDSYNATYGIENKVVRYDPHTPGRIVIVWKDRGGTYDDGYAIAATIVGDQITYGTEVKFTGSNVNVSYLDFAFDLNTPDKFVIVYPGKAIVGTLSGTSTISFGTEVSISSGDHFSIAFNPHSVIYSTFLVCYDHSSTGKVALYKRDGDTITVITTATTYTSGSASFNKLSFDPFLPNKFIIGYFGSSNNSYIIGKIDHNNAITFGTVGNVDTGSINQGHDIKVFYSPIHKNKVYYGYQRMYSPSGVWVYEGTVDGTIVTWSPKEILYSGLTGHDGCVDFAVDLFKPGRMISIYQKDGVTYNPQQVDIGAISIQQFESSNLTAANFVGMSNSAYASGTEVGVQGMGIVDDAQTGLGPGGRYYLHSDGSLSTVKGNPVVVAGTAITATKLRIGE